MDITYYVDDGYAASERRPHHVKVDDADLEECETEQEKLNLIDEAIAHHFFENITWYWNRKL